MKTYETNSFDFITFCLVLCIYGTEHLLCFTLLKSLIRHGFI